MSFLYIVGSVLSDLYKFYSSFWIGGRCQLNTSQVCVFAFSSYTLTVADVHHELVQIIVAPVVWNGDSLLLR